MSTDKENGGGIPAFEPIGEEEKAMIEDFVLDFAKEISTDGGKTAKIKGATIVLDQPTAQPKTGK